MKWKIYILILFLLSNCNEGIPDDETGCDFGRVFALVLINRGEIAKENGKETAATNLLPANILLISCSSDNKRPSTGP